MVTSGENHRQGAADVGMEMALQHSFRGQEVVFQRLCSASRKPTEAIRKQPPGKCDRRRKQESFCRNRNIENIDGSAA